MIFSDALTLDAPKRTKDGYLAVRAKSARIGVYDYAGHEVDPDNRYGLRNKALVKVLRDDATVFDRSAVQSFVGKPVTNDHPSQSVNATNWRDHARGTIMGALRDGDYLAFDLLLTDQSAIDAVNNGKRELSNGYAAELEFGQFTAADGTVCDARQSKITGGNHVALVDRGRAGPSCAIADVAICDSNPARVAELSKTKEDRVKVINLDGLSVNTSDAQATESAITTLDNKLTTAMSDKRKVETELATATTDKANLEAEVTTLKKQIEDSKLTPQQLRDAAKAFANTCDKAKALGVSVSDDMDEAAIRKAVVSAKIGDAAANWSDDQVSASFATLTADVKTSDSKVVNIAPVQTFNSTASIRDAARAARNA